MIPFKVHQLLIGGRYVLPLPKLSSPQQRFLAAEIEKKGFAVRQEAGSVTATSRGYTVHLEQAGYCWSSKDPSDLILPLVPDLLAFPKERVHAREFSQMYFSSFFADGVPSVKARPRLETASNWRRLRASGDCGLTPDERLATAKLMASADHVGPLVTDFPTDESPPMIIGRRLYFQSLVSGAEAGAALRAVGETKPRNCYVPRDGIFRNFEPSLAMKCASEVALEAGEWCFFEPE
ncbi:MAG: hypothetical protein JRN33_08105 [Nitrososphaerota archaeon]|nr:hypothetical protein [Nitrososphaerota archaeon]